MKLILAALFPLLASPVLAQTATTTLWAPGPNNSGVYVPEFNIMASELDSLAASNGVPTAGLASSTNIFTNSQTGATPYARMKLTIGGSWTPGNGQILNCWFLTTDDTSSPPTKFESVAIASARAPDFVFPLQNYSGFSYSTGSLVYSSGPYVTIPSLKFEVLSQNSVISNGTAMPTGNTITLIPMAVQRK